MTLDYRKSARNFSLVSSVGKEFISNLVFAKDNRKSLENCDKIGIVGGELFNKGAQAMTFTVVDQLSKRFPEKDVYLFSSRDYRRPAKEKSQYTFEILPWGPEIQLSALAPNLHSVNSTEHETATVQNVRNVLSSCTFLIDINGYALSSQRGFSTSFGYVSNIIIAKNYGLPMYVLPQSVGPFDYATPKQFVLNPLLQTYLSYPEVICARETAGVEEISRYTRNNVRHEFDIVLQNRDYDLDNIYEADPDIKRWDVAPDAVGIVPNSNVFERGNSEEIYDLYERVVEKLLENHRSVYILRHSVEDLQYCENIKRRFKDEEKVELVGEELNAIELEYIIDQFDYMIGSRYHSLIHAYKNGTPVLAIGWAVKYRELLQEFNQTQYFFEGRDRIDTQEFLDAVSLMDSKYTTESERITERREEILERDLFQELFSDSVASSEN